MPGLRVWGSGLLRVSGGLGFRVWGFRQRA